MEFGIVISAIMMYVNNAQIDVLVILRYYFIGAIKHLYINFYINTI